MIIQEGYTTFAGVKCVILQDKGRIKLIPTNEEDIQKLNRHFDDQKFFFYHSDSIDKNCISFIDRVEIDEGCSINLIPIYTVKLLKFDEINSMEVIGQSIDEIFHPASFYYFKPKNKKDFNLTYEAEIADTWTVIIDGVPVEINLQYGNILSRGIVSDMKLHPRIVASFPKTKESMFIYKVYLTITRFLQITQYNSNFGECRVYLHGGGPQYNSGIFFDWKNVGEIRNFYNQVEYRYLQPYIQKLLQFSADNMDISLRFLPDATYRWHRTDYYPEIIPLLFAAFESEYAANKTFYETVPEEDIGALKEKMLEKLTDCITDDMSGADKAFIAQAKNSIKNLGNQVGQTRKMQNVIGALEPIFRSSAQHLFIRGRLGSSDGFSSEEINKIVKQIVGLRAQISHEYTLTELNDEQTEYVRFLEILVYSQMLKRAGIDNEGIEILIGIVFNCNFVFMEKLLNK